jgi:hypothetical protein
MDGTYAPVLLPIPAEAPIFGVFEATIEIGLPIEDPFRRVSLQVEATLPSGRLLKIDGFCDSADGSVFRFRIMPTEIGDVRFSATWRIDEQEATFEGAFRAVQSSSHGMLEVNPDRPHHFRWSHSHAPFFWNATTCYMLAGLEPSLARSALERLHSYEINRIRVSLSPSRQKDGGRWSEAQVKPRDGFTFFYGPWPSLYPDQHENPGWDVTRFQVAYWRTYESLLKLAGELGINVQVVFFTDAQEAPNYPFPRDQFGDNEDERRYYRYAVARLACFSNVEWCVTNEWRLFRPDEWVEEIGAYLAELDPYGHLTSVHGHEVFPFRASPWVTHALYQLWDEGGGYAGMSAQREAQDATGFPKPVINDEFGYEDHEPTYAGATPTSRDWKSRLRIAWEIAMAGCYCTTGESPRDGVGGWINGLCVKPSPMLEGHLVLKRFFQSFDWQALTPDPSLGEGCYVLSEKNAQYVVFFPAGADATVKFDVEGLKGYWLDIYSGVRTEYVAANGLKPPHDHKDWVLRLTRN